MKKYTFYGCVVTLLGVACVSLAAIALGTTRWKYDFNSLEEDGLFERCNPGLSRDSCITGIDDFTSAYIRATQSLMIIGTFSALIGIFVALLIACGKGTKVCHIITGSLFLIAGVFMLIACAVYTGVNQPNLARNASRFGYSLWLAWAATILAFLITPIAFIAKTNKDEYA